MVPNIAVVGCGYWGKNIVRNFYELGALRSICDLRESVLNELGTTYQVRTSPRVEEILSDPQVEGVAIAAPAAQHYDLVMRSLLAGKHVLVEKPLALHLEDGQKLVMTARECQRLLMIGHILQYHPAILKLKELNSSGELGQIKYIYSSRLNLGKLRTEEN